MKKLFHIKKENDLLINIEFYEHLKREGLLSFEKLWNLKGPYFFYKKRYRTIEAFDFGKLKIYLKKYHQKSEEAETEWKTILLLWKNHLKTLIPVLLAKSKKTKKAIIATQELTFPSSIELIQKNPRCTEIVISHVAIYLARFHEKGFYHQDCYLGHFHFDPKKESVYIIDVPRVKYKPLFWQKYLIKDLAQMRYSFKEKFKEKDNFWWSFFWERYNLARNKKLSKSWYLLTKIKFKLIERHTRRVKARGGDGVITYYNNL